MDVATVEVETEVSRQYEDPPPPEEEPRDVGSKAVTGLVCSQIRA